MITFKTFLEENKEYESEAGGAPSELAKLINEKCNQALLNWRDGDKLWRGSKNVKPSGIFRPDAGERASANTQNFYTKLLDSNPLNDGFPKRSKSFICTTKHIVATMYGKKGTTYAVFPFDGTPIGQVNQHDIWEVKMNFDLQLGISGETLQSMNGFWENLHLEFKKDMSWTPTMQDCIKFYSHVDPEKFVKELQAQGFLSRGSTTPEYNQKILKLFLEELPKAYSYKKMGCELKEPDSYHGSFTEIWFSGPCIMVNSDDWIGVSMELGL